MLSGLEVIGSAHFKVKGFKKGLPGVQGLWFGVQRLVSGFRADSFLDSRVGDLVAEFEIH